MVSQGWDVQEGPPPLVQVVLTRTQAGNDHTGRMAIALYLVDPGCLGVKNTFGQFCTADQRQRIITGAAKMVRLVEEDAAIAAMIIGQSIDYAAKLGFAPHPDFRHTQLMLTGIEPAGDTHRLRLGGPEGKPWFVPGPDDDPAKIMRQLTERLGVNGFHYVYG
jgi:hypothetical protein